MNSVSQTAKKTTKQTAAQVAKAVRDQSLEFVRESSKQLSPAPNDLVPERQHPLESTKIDEKGSIATSEEEANRLKQIDDRYLKGLEAEVARLRKQRENEILEQKKQEDGAKLTQEQQELEQIEVAPPGDKSFKARSAGLMGKAKNKGKSVMMENIKRKQSSEVGKMPSN